ncbi:helix-hairpin-helix domain-containing protein [Leisingera thetidis]|uniref:helix-hairpin-helix domain-containing protein n=1 Tax=Leisingera thetidis TaxID=2930199 RepID=UPI0021F7C465|nr:helix-hairpin-helix domain-containing protein [Leisingera thetidis]
MMPIRKMRGVGPALARHLLAHGVATVEDLAGMDESELCSIPNIGASRAAVLKKVARTETETMAESKPAAQAAGGGRVTPETRHSEKASEQSTPPSQDEMNARLAEAEAARQAAEGKAVKAQAKARKAKRMAAQLAEEFAVARVKAKKKAKKMKAKAKKAIEKEKAKAKAILDGQASGKKKSKSKK